MNEKDTYNIPPTPIPRKISQYVDFYYHHNRGGSRVCLPKEESPNIFLVYSVSFFHGVNKQETGVFIFG